MGISDLEVGDTVARKSYGLKDDMYEVVSICRDEKTVLIKRLRDWSEIEEVNLATTRLYKEKVSLVEEDLPDGSTIVMCYDNCEKYEKVDKPWYFDEEEQSSLARALRARYRCKNHE